MFSDHLSEDEEIDNTLPATLEAIKKDNVFEKKITEWRATIENLTDTDEIKKLTEKIEEAETKLKKNADQIKTFEDGLNIRANYRESEKALFEAKKQSRNQVAKNDKESLEKLVTTRQNLINDATTKKTNAQIEENRIAAIRKRTRSDSNRKMEQPHLFRTGMDYNFW